MGSSQSQQSNGSSEETNHTERIKEELNQMCAADEAAGGSGGEKELSGANAALCEMIVHGLQEALDSGEQNRVISYNRVPTNSSANEGLPFTVKPRQAHSCYHSTSSNAGASGEQPIENLPCSGSQSFGFSRTTNTDPSTPAGTAASAASLEDAAELVAAADGSLGFQRASNSPASVRAMLSEVLGAESLVSDDSSIRDSTQPLFARVQQPPTGGKTDYVVSDESSFSASAIPRSASLGEASILNDLQGKLPPMPSDDSTCASPRMKRLEHELNLAVKGLTEGRLPIVLDLETSQEEEICSIKITVQSKKGAKGAPEQQIPIEIVDASSASDSQQSASEAPTAAPEPPQQTIIFDEAVPMDAVPDNDGKHADSDCASGSVDYPESRSVKSLVERFEHIIQARGADCSEESDG
ncbi:hypothetical protein PAPHI01_1581 [Pancytospora philotis]|nr:hypothetical protein PAPHI01_1581 [Pancytospora philotis]